MIFLSMTGSIILWGSLIFLNHWDKLYRAVAQVAANINFPLFFVSSSEDASLFFIPSYSSSSVFSGKLFTIF